MASVVPSKNGVLFHQSFLELDQSIRSLQEQISDICETLDIELKEPPHYLEINCEQTSCHHGPREEWTLRWILKNFHHTEPTIGSPCLEYSLWLLLYELINRNSLSKIVENLSTHGFLDVVQNTLQWIYKSDFFLSAIPSNWDPSIALDPSTVLPQEPLDVKLKLPRKRKHDNSCNSTNDSEIDVKNLFLSISATLKRVSVLATDSSSVSRTHGMKQLKSYLTSSPDKAAAILGRSISLAKLFLVNQSTESDTFANTSFHNYFSPMVDIWTLHATFAKDTPSWTESLRLFSEHCLMPSLEICAINNVSASRSPVIKGISRCLETLLTQNIILPVRESLLILESPANKRSTFRTSSTARSLLAPIAGFSISQGCSHPNGSSYNSASLPGPLIFDIAVRSLPRSTLKQCSLEDSWLLKLFDMLLDYVGSSEEQLLQSEFGASTLRQMLQIVSTHKIRLPLFKTQEIIAQVLKLLSDRLCEHLHWNLIRLCLEINPRALVQSSSVDGHGKQQSDIESNSNLPVLLHWVTSTTGNLLLDDTGLYEEILLHVVLPILKAFAKARHLIFFIELWRGQLIAAYTLLASDKPLRTLASRGVWEDDMLLHETANYTEKTLSGQQFRRILQGVEDNIRTMTRNTSEECSVFAADLVILDCLLEVSAPESDMVWLETSIFTIYHSVLLMASDKKFQPLNCKWRLWRILTTCNQRWLRSSKSSQIKSAEIVALKQAVGPLQKLELDASERSDSNNTYMEAMYSFSFAVSQSHKIEEENDQDSLPSTAIALIIRHILKENLRDPSVKTESPEKISSWDGQSRTITSPEILSLGCVYQIFDNPSTLSLLNPQDMKNLFHHVLQNAAFIKLHHRQQSDVIRETKHINYLLLWQKLLVAEFLREHVSLRRSLAANLASVLLLKDPRHGWETDIFAATLHSLLIESIQRISIHAFHRKQKAQIFRHVLRSLIANALGPLESVMDPLNLLLQLVRTGGKYLFALGDLDENSDVTSANRSANYNAPLINLALRLARDNVAEVLVFQKIVKTILGKCSLTIGEEKTVDLLLSYFQHLLQTFDDQAGGSNLMYMTLVNVSLSFFSTHLSMFPDEMRPNFASLDSLCQHRVNSLCSWIEACASKIAIYSPVMRKKLIIVLDSMLLYSHILITHPIRAKIWSHCRDIVEQLAQVKHPGRIEANGDLSSDLDSLSIRLSRLQLALRNPISEEGQPMTTMTQMLGQLRSPIAKARMLHYLQTFIINLQLESRIELLSALTKGCDGRLTDSNILRLLLRGLWTFKGQDSSDESSNNVLVRIYALLCDRFLQSEAVEAHTTVLTMKCMYVLLCNQGRIISQWHIDNTLVIITVVSSQSQDQHSSMIFTGLCKLFSALLVFHRRKLGGRYHLLIPALQGLLACFFTPYPTSTTSSSQPLEPSSVQALGERDATAYAHLLTSVCNPSVSAVTRHGKHQPSRLLLNDETKRARSIGGQHLQYLIVKYCTCQLQGRVLPDVKKALMPGLYAIFDAMSVDVMRVANASLDAAGRTVFKRLYVDWKQFGRWKGG